MAIREDRRPTLASWPKRIYDWEELPERFRPALEVWRAQGLPPGNVTYIPKVHQYKKGVEYVTAWLGEEVLLLTGGDQGVESTLVRPGDVVRMTYTIQLLKCFVEVLLDRGGETVAVGFSYNRTKEDQLFPVLNLLLGNAPDHRPGLTHPADPPLERLLIDSYAMYNNSKLCYRFGDTIRDSLWVPGRNYGLQTFRKQKPEYFVGKMDRGVVVIHTDFYARRTVYLTWERIREVAVEEAAFRGPGPRRRPALVLKTTCGEPVALPLLPGQEEAAKAFAARLL